MLQFPQWLIVFSIVLLSFTLVLFLISIIPWGSCKKSRNEKEDYIASWSRMTIPHHDTFSVSPLPPYFFVNGVIGYDKYASLV